jgi:peptidyl-prolyl cis-trans isomerase C
MKLARLAIVFLLSLFFIFPGCKATSKNEQKSQTVLATVNGTPITADDVLLRLGGHENLYDTPLKDKVLDDIINDELLYQKGVNLGLDKDEKYQSKIRLMELKIESYKRAEIARMVRQSQINAHTAVSAEEIKDYYDKHADEIGTDLHIAFIQFFDESQAKDALAKVRAGIPFAKIAAGKVANTPKGDRPWDKGFLHWNQIPMLFVDSVYGLKKGEVSDVLIAAPDETYLVEVLDKKKNSNASFDSMRGIIENRLYVMKTKQTFVQYLQQLKKEATIKKNN